MTWPSAVTLGDLDLDEDSVSPPLTCNSMLMMHRREILQWQIDIGHGRHTNESDDVSLPESFRCAESTVQSLIDTIYPGIGLLPDLDEDSVSPPLTIPNLYWSARVLRWDGFFVTVKAMIDNGAHIILIRPDMVEALSLEWKHLWKPQVINVAMNEEKKKRKTLIGVHSRSEEQV